ncbi:MAG: hypothetical protein ACXV74_10570 [Methylobacter sp.]
MVPILLLCLATFITVTHHEFLFTDFETRQAKLTILIDGIESGKIAPNDEQIVRYLKASRDVETSFKGYIAAIVESYGKLAELLYTLGLAQLAILFGYFRKKNRANGVSSSEI